MDISTVNQGYCDAVMDTDRESALHIIDVAMESGIAAEQLVFDVVLPALDHMLHVIAARDDATLAQHFMTARVSEEVVEALLPKFRQRPSCSGVVVLGTARGDFHGLGKKIVAGTLRAHMYTVHDAGLNVSPLQFVDLAAETGATVIGVSSMMMHTTVGDEGPLGVRAELTRRGLDKRIRLIVDGAPYRFDDTLYRRVSADAFAQDAFSAVAVVSALCARGEHHA
ncbi:MAG: cobalamin-dependent protein [Deltaproteobacteria bacterium]|nr:cobalamin-dependent protein [Deltaproteobacteria bacterium]